MTQPPSEMSVALREKIKEIVRATIREEISSSEATDQILAILALLSSLPLEGDMASVERAEAGEIVQRSQAGLMLRGDARMNTIIGGPMAGWRDIESAPKDGTHILVTEAGRGGLGYCGPINEHGFRSLADWCDVVHWFDDPDEPGFYSTSWGGDQEHPFRNLTHWRPLPRPPAENRARGAAGEAEAAISSLDDPHHPSTQESENG